ncbi:ABC transporter permease subunit [Cryptosporangium japonicum]|uniref:ABC transporter permease subunit n=1 Tax=Cryptosporangium japonicum TaxID=80872 RepID=A0ABN0TPR9_9ACTN
MIAAELIKLRTLRSTPIALVLAVLVSGGLSALLGSAADDGKMIGEFDPLFVAFYGLTLGQLPLVAFAVLAVGSEYRSGTIRASLAAVPRRARFFGAKVGAALLVLAATALATVAVSVLLAQTTLGTRRAALGDALPAAAGAWLYLTLIGLFALGFATLVRSSTVALGVLLPLLLLGSQGLGNVPGVRVVTQYLPDQLGWVVMHLAGPQGDPRWARDYGPWSGLALLALWAAAALVAGYTSLHRRDA